MQKNEMLLCLGIYGKVTEWAQTDISKDLTYVNGVWDCLG